MAIKVIHVDLRKLDLTRAIPGIRKGLRQGGELIAEELKTYPTQKLGRRQPPVSARQRAFLIRAIDEGRITVPYRRSGQLGHSWSKKGPFVRGSRMLVEIGSDPSVAPWAIYVQSDEYQTEFHKEGGWKTPGQVLKEKGDKVIALIEDGLRKGLK